MWLRAIKSPSSPALPWSACKTCRKKGIQICSTALARKPTQPLHFIFHAQEMPLQREPFNSFRLRNWAGFESCPSPFKGLEGLTRAHPGPSSSSWRRRRKSRVGALALSLHPIQLCTAATSLSTDSHMLETERWPVMLRPCHRAEGTTILFPRAGLGPLSSHPPSPSSSMSLPTHNQMVLGDETLIYPILNSFR